ncbi:DUF4367 domain-containing protein [Clostridium sp. AM30-24]|nr:DUF4367 domain-containing protein [Clostridium sp. AM30-24]RHT41757.1 DUF4367 domain-containing protein [Clostridium sp. AM30-24]
MADTEKNEDQKISRCLQEAFGYTDEQLLKQLDQANETLKDVTFDGAEDRIMKKIMARKAELEKETSASELERERNITLVKAKTEDRKDKKSVRFGKKKVLATVALVAVIAGMLGGTAVGKKNYFFRKTERSVASIVVDNDKNKSEKPRLENAYQEISEKLKSPVLKMSYCLADMHLTEVKIFKDQAQLLFTYNNNIISFFQTKSDNSTSAKFKFDEKDKQEVYNKWLNRSIEYTVNKQESGSTEYESLIIVDNSLYYLAGVLPKEEFESVLENLNFFE